MPYILKVYGKASSKVIKEIRLNQSDLEGDLMNLLIKNKLPIASSCNGVGTCKKCSVFLREEEVLSCQKSLRNLFSINKNITIVINYL